MNHEAQRIIDFVCQNRTTRRMPATQIHQELFPDPDCGIGVDAVRNCLHRAGFTRRAALRKPFINEINRRKRFIFALEHVHWTVEDWYRILWSDETWATAGLHAGEYVWCRDHEVLEDDCVSRRF